MTYEGWMAARQLLAFERFASVRQQQKAEDRRFAASLAALERDSRAG